MKKVVFSLCVLSSLLISSLVACKTTAPTSPAAESSLKLELVARHVSGQYGEGAAEILGYDAKHHNLYVVNGAAKAIDIIPISSLPDEVLPLPFSGQNLTSQRLNLPSSIDTHEQGRLTIGSPSSLSIHDELMAVAVTHSDEQQVGAVLFYQLHSNHTTFIKAVSVGSLPDMVTFTHDGTLALVANEGEPSHDYRNDPEGSISIIEISTEMSTKIGTEIGTEIANTATHLSFAQFNNQRAELEQSGVKFASPEGTSVAQDLEPEYITVSVNNDKAFVSLQENNAIAIIDLASKRIDAIKGLGYKDWSQYKIDVSNKDGVNAAYYENLYGLYQPDSLASYQVDGKTYILSANEGDAREYIYSATKAECLAAGHKYDDEDGCISYSEEYRVKKLSIKSPSVIDSYYKKDGIGRLKVTNVLGDDNNDGMYDKLYSYGARSFSIWDEEGHLVFDSGDYIEQYLLKHYGEDFNNNESENQGDSRSDDKGAEPEALITGVIEGRTYAFLGLERQGGIMIFDVSDPRQPVFQSYTNNRDFSQEFEIDDDTDPVTLKGAYDQVGDLAPEGLVFISAADSPTGKPLLAVANEVSGSVSIYSIQ
ncbi:choice-of-anchor I family protein [Kangiella marina]|uniref:Choice-of-anchor I family protein n=1 Tax=Kangiella marina TaxID=1079178 RepID=A0ABP8IM91_9GAMM